MKSNINHNNDCTQSQTNTTELPSLPQGLDKGSLSNCSFPTLDGNYSQKSLRNSIQEKASQGEYEMAISILDCLIACNPNNAADYNNRGLMYFRNNQIIEALCDLSQALAIDPYLDSAYNNRANCHAAQGDLSSAIADYDLALDINPANLRAWINQGITFRELELYDLALENLEIALIIGNTLEGRIYAERGRTYHLRGDWNCAAGDYYKALKMLAIAPQSTRYYQKVERWFAELLCPLEIVDRL